jgi:sulfatase maturation enzyme AslB (radical SAM superfamily)
MKLKEPTMNCNDCPKRSTCKELCPEAERYADQDSDEKKPKKETDEYRRKRILLFGY